MKRAWFFLLVGLISLAIGLITGREMFFNMVYLIALALILSFIWAWTGISSVSIARRTRSRRSSVGKLAEESFTVANTGILPKVWLEIRDHSTLPVHRVSQVLNALPPKRRRHWAVRTICRRRGRFTLGPLSLVSGDPLGLFEFRRDLRISSDIVIYPAMIPIPSFAPPLGQLPGGDAVRHRTHYITTNVAGVRDYAPGDSFSRIHWRSTARTGRLIVKEFELDPTADIWLLPDMNQNVQYSLPIEEPEPQDPWVAILRGRRRPEIELDPATEEYAVTVVASIAQHFIHKDRAVGLLTYAQGREIMQPDRGHRQLTKMLETLAVIRAESDIALGQILLSEGAWLGRGVTLVVITSSLDSMWVAAARDIRRRGVSVIAVVIDPQGFGGPEGAETTIAELRASRIPAYLVSKDANLSQALSRGISFVRPPI